MIVVHHLENSRSQRVLWLLEELKLKYEVKRYARDPKTMLAPAELKQVHPLGKSPVINDGDITVAESGAIIEYLLDTYGEGRLRPAPGTPERRRFTYWLHFAEGSAMPLMVMKLVFEQVRKAKVPFFLKPVLNGVANKAGSSFLDPNIDAQHRFIESELAARPWFAGSEFSAADNQMSFPLEAAASRTALASKYPKAAAWLERIHARPAYKAALKVGGPYNLLK